MAGNHFKNGDGERSAVPPRSNGLETLAYRVDPAKTVLATVRLRAKRRCLPLCTNSLKRQNRLVA